MAPPSCQRFLSASGHWKETIRFVQADRKRSTELPLKAPTVVTATRIPATGLPCVSTILPWIT